MLWSKTKAVSTLYRLTILLALLLCLPISTRATADACLDFIGDQVKSLDPATLVAEGKAAFEAAQCTGYAEDPVFIALTSVLVGLKVASKISDKDSCENAIDGVLGKTLVTLLQQSGPLWDALPDDLRQSITDNPGQSLKDIPGIAILLDQFNCACIVATNPAVDQFKQEANDGYGCAAEVVHTIEEIGTVIVSGPIKAIDYLACKAGLGGCDDPPKDRQCEWVQCPFGAQCGGPTNDSCVACPAGNDPAGGIKACNCASYLTEVSHVLGTHTIVDACLCQAPLRFVNDGTGGVRCGCPDGLAVKASWDGTKDVYTCEACPQDQTVGADGYSCTYCPSNQVADANGQCVDCAQGAHTAMKWKDGHEVPTCVCPVGMGYDVKNINGTNEVYCKACIGDTVSRWDNLACVTCPANAKPTWDKGRQATVCKCQQGFVFENVSKNDYSDYTGTHGQCVSLGAPCPDGKHRDGVGGACVNANGCVDGEVSIWANEVLGNTCKSCPSPYQTVVDNSCVSCPAGQAGDGSGYCFTCAAGSMSDGHGGPCVFGCPAGQIYTGTSYNIVTGAVTPGSAGNAAGGCQVCPSNSIPDKTRTKCIATTGSKATLLQSFAPPHWPTPPGMLNAMADCSHSQYTIRRDGVGRGCAVCPLGMRANWNHSACVADTDPPLLALAIPPAGPPTFSPIPIGVMAFSPIPPSARQDGRPEGAIIIPFLPKRSPANQSLPVTLTPPVKDVGNSSPSVLPRPSIAPQRPRTSAGTGTPDRKADEAAPKSSIHIPPDVKIVPPRPKSPSVSAAPPKRVTGKADATGAKKIPKKQN